MNTAIASPRSTPSDPVRNCPICDQLVKESRINSHLDASCTRFIEQPIATTSSQTPARSENGAPPSKVQKSLQEPVRRNPFEKAPSTTKAEDHIKEPASSPIPNGEATPRLDLPGAGQNGMNASVKRTAEALNETTVVGISPFTEGPEPKKQKPTNALQRVAPLAERMRPQTLNDVYGQDLVGPHGVLRGLIEADRTPSMILWGGAGTGKTTIARVVANVSGSRFIEINATSSGVGELKKIFGEARGELQLTGRKTIIFCDEIHRFSKSQQDVFLGPVEAGHVTLIGATTENPSFKVQNALLSRCRTFTLQKLTDRSVTSILQRALKIEYPLDPPPSLIDYDLLQYLASFSDGDARTALNLLDLSISLAARQPPPTIEALKSALTKSLVYDRAGDQHYDSISALHKSVRGSDPDAALYYLARMLQSGEDPLYIARRLIVIASEDVGLADNTMLSLATSAYAAAEKIGMPECRINLAHATVALAMSKKSTRSYRGLANAEKALGEPGIAGLPIPIHLRNAPTRMMKEMGYGKEYKYNPDYLDGKVKQDYLPEKLKGRKFLEDRDLGEQVDGDVRDFSWM
ncbi:hypothetical protein MMC25_002782 [Agyrium rufum]|nr:hypothetical protein [Agyrium rufum]